MESPYAPRRRRPGEEPAPKSTFQRELDAKMRDRRSRGLATDVTTSEDELGSDDELMAHFNMTNKPQPSPRGGDCGEGRKSPWAPPGMKKPETTKQRSAYEDISHHSNRRSPYDESAPYSSRQSPHDERLPSTTNTRKSPYGDSSAPYGSSKRSPYEESAPYGSKSRSSPFDSSVRHSSPTSVIFGTKNKDTDGEDMLKTMKRPGGWKPPSANIRTSPAALPRRSQYESEDEPSDNGSDEIKSVSLQRNRPMSAMRHHRDPHPDKEDKENRIRTKSPGIRGRKTPTFRDSLDDQEEPPHPTPRARSSSSGGIGRDAEPSRPRPKPRTGKEAERDADRETSRFRRTPTSDVTGGKSSRSGTPKNEHDGRKTPTDRRKSLIEIMDDKPETKPRKRTNLLSDSESDDERKSPFKPVPRGRAGLLKDARKDYRDDYPKGRKSPYGDTSKNRYGPESNRKSPHDEKKLGMRSPSYNLDKDNENRGPRGKSPIDQKSRGTTRKSPLDFKGGQRDDKGRKSPYGGWEHEDEYEDDYKSKNRRARRSPWDDQDDDRRLKGRRNSLEEEKDAGRHTKGRRSPWEEELDRKKDKIDEKGGTRRKSLVREDEKVNQTESKLQSADRRSPWEQDNRRGYGEGKHRDGDEDDWRRGRHPKREESDDKNVHWVSRDRPPPLRRSPAVVPDDDNEYRRRGNSGNRRQDSHDECYQYQRDDKADDRYLRGHHVDRDDSYSRHYDDNYDNRYQRRSDDRDGSHYPHDRDDRDDDRRQRRHDDSDDGGYERGRHEEGQERRSKPRKSRSHVEQESSVCGDVEVDPTMRPPQTREGKEIEKRQPHHQRKEKQMLDDAIDTIKDAQHRSTSAGERKMRYIDPATESAEKATRPQSSHTPRLKPKPRYANPNTISMNPANFDSTLNIRDSVYQQWYAERMDTARREKRTKLKKEQEEEEKQKKVKEEKYYGAKASYDSWLENKKSKIGIEKRKKAQLEEKKKQTEEEKRCDKLKDAEMIFRRWKEDKDHVLKQKARSKKKEEEAALKEKQDLQFEKRKDAEKVFKGWKSTKDEILIEKAHEKQEAERKKQRMEHKMKRRREREAHSSYNDWLDKKETQTQNELNKRRFEDEEEWKPAWKPNTSTIPFGR